MQSKVTKTLIIGGGVAGLATAWHLGKKLGASAKSVLLLEKEPLCGSHSSALNAAILRSFGYDPITARIARAAADFLRQPPEGFAPHALLNPCGLILGGSGETASQMRMALDAYGAAAGARELSRAEVGELAPHLDPGAELYLYFEQEGQLDISAEIAGFQRGARLSGVRLQTGLGVQRLLRDGTRVIGAQLEDGSTIHAETTVVAAGGWADALGQGVGSSVRTQATRRHLMVSSQDPSIDRAWPIVWLDDAGFYCRPESGGMLVSACDLSPTDPNQCQRDPAVLELLAAKVAAHTPRFAGAGVAHYWCGMRTLSSDERFHVGPDPDLSGLFWVAALGGHGMTCGPEIGRLAATLLLNASTGEDEELLAAINPGRSSAPVGDVSLEALPGRIPKNQLDSLGSQEAPYEAKNVQL